MKNADVYVGLFLAGALTFAVLSEASEHVKFPGSEKPIIKFDNSRSGYPIIMIEYEGPLKFEENKDDKGNLISMGWNQGKPKRMTISGESGPIAHISLKDGTVTLLQPGKEPEAARLFWQSVASAFLKCKQEPSK